jgi:hypothetical protein
MPQPPGALGFSLERMVRAVEKVTQRLRRTTAALENAEMCYAVVGDNAVTAWVTTVDAAAVRNTADVDILLRRADLPAATAALSAAGFIYEEGAGVHMFVDGPAASPRDAVHVIFAGEKVYPTDIYASPDVTESRPAEGYRVANLEALVGMKLTAFRDKDRTHLRDLLDVGLLDPSWVSRFPAELGARLQQLIDTPGG